MLNARPGALQNAVRSVILLPKEHEGLLYCFVAEDLEAGSERDPLRLQAACAQALDVFCLCRLADRSSSGVLPEGRRVLLRASVSTQDVASGLLRARGARLVEDSVAVEKIECWDALGLTRRPVLPLTAGAIVQGGLGKAERAMLERCPFVFLKSRKKGFHARASSRRLLEPDEALRGFLTDAAERWGEALMLSPWLSIRTDSLGKRESRHIVLDGSIINASRPLHSIRHTVPRALTEAATLLAARLAREPGFPRSYALDVAEFQTERGPLVDLVELNPISTSMCYVNNSVFPKIPFAAVRFHDRTGMGAEYCLDALEHPERYVMERTANESYAYTDDNSFEFL